MRELLLYLKGRTLYGLKDGREVAAPLEDFPERGRAVLLLDKDDLWHSVVTLPSSPHLKVGKVLEHEAEGALGGLKDQVLRWRKVGSRQGEDIYLLMALPRQRALELAEALGERGVYPRRALSPLDLLVELGKGWAGRRNCCVLLLDGQEVTLLLYTGGEFVFWRDFSLATPVEDPQVADELATELRRSSLYLLQQYKVRAEAAVVTAPPKWLTHEGAREISAKSGVEVELQPLPKRASPWLALMEEGWQLLEGLRCLLPAEVKATLVLHRRQLAVALASLLVAIALLCWAGLRYLEYQALKEVLEHSRQVIRLWEPLLEKRKKRLEELKSLRAEREELFEMLRQRSLARLPLEALGYLVPEGAHLQRAAWQRQGEKEVLVLEVRVEPEGLERRYLLYQKVVQRLKEAPFVEEVRSDTLRLLKEGAFALTVVLKGVDRGV